MEYLKTMDLGVVNWGCIRRYGEDKRGVFVIINERQTEMNPAGTKQAHLLRIEIISQRGR